MGKQKLNLQELPRFRDGLSYHYTEHARVEKEDASIACHTIKGKVLVPTAQLAVLMLGPGVSITSAAIDVLAQNGCLVMWVGEQGVRYYATGLGETRSSQHIHKQAICFAHPEKHLSIVRKLYQMRFKEKLSETHTLEQIRGFEGVRVRTAYQQASKASGIPWSGRKYSRMAWNDSDPLNRAISAGNACLYGICHSAIVSAGYTPALGFIHVGKQLSFVYDVADLYKLELVVPTAFRTVKESLENIETRMRHQLRDSIKELKLLGRIVNDLHTIFDEQDLPDTYAVDFALPSMIWDTEEYVEGGVAYGDDRDGESAT